VVQEPEETLIDCALVIKVEDKKLKAFKYTIEDFQCVSEPVKKTLRKVLTTGDFSNLTVNERFGLCKILTLTARICDGLNTPLFDSAEEADKAAKLLSDTFFDLIDGKPLGGEG
jgi:hypothetical protein